MDLESERRACHGGAPFFVAMIKETRKQQRARDKALLDARQKIVEAVPVIIKKLIEGAQDGNAQQAKFLFEFAELSAAPGVAESPSLSRIVLNFLREEEAAAEAAMPASPATTAAG